MTAIAQALLTTESFSLPIGTPRKWNPSGKMRGWDVQCFYCHQIWAQIRIVLRDDEGARVLPYAGHSFRVCPDCGRGSILEELERAAPFVGYLWDDDVLPASMELLKWEMDVVERNWNK